MKLRADDAIRRARLVYLGWGDNPLPVQWPYAKWMLFGATFGVLSVIGFAIFRTAKVLTITFALALVATSWVWDRVDADRPARSVIRRLARDWRADRDRGNPTELPAPTAGHIRLSRSDRTGGRP